MNCEPITARELGLGDSDAGQECAFGKAGMKKPKKPRTKKGQCVMSIEHSKSASSITVADLEANPVWQFTGQDEPDETFVRVVKSLPVRDLNGKIVGTQVRLANGNQVWALIGNVDASNTGSTEHFLTMSVECGGEWFHLARYHDVDRAEHGPEALARCLGLRVDEVFPISYDLRPYVEGGPAALRGVVQQEPGERLARAELLAMAVP